MEFRPHVRSALTEKRDSASTSSKTPVKHNSAGHVVAPKDARKSEPRPEEKVIISPSSACYFPVLSNIVCAFVVNRVS